MFHASLLDCATIPNIKNTQQITTDGLENADPGVTTGMFFTAGIIPYTASSLLTSIWL